MSDVNPELTQAIADELVRQGGYREDESNLISMDWQEGSAVDLRALAAVVEGVLHPVITTVEELDALPQASVIRDSRGEVCERWSFMGSLGWLATGDRERCWRITLPATVLYRPEPS